MQAVAGIPETGVCDSATWEALLGAEALQEALQEAAQLVSVPFRQAICACQMRVSADGAEYATTSGYLRMSDACFS